MASPLNSESSSILIVGAGTWGSSTALHLARRGYKHITLLDPYPVPSAISAGNDVNKILSGHDQKTNVDRKQPLGTFSGPEDDEAYVSNTLLNRATEAWQKDHVFAPYYHETGYIVAASDPASIAALEKREQPTPEDGYVELNTPDQFRQTMPAGVLTGDFPGWKGWHKASGAGWVHARKALVAAATEAERLGAKFVTGPAQGNVTSLIFEEGDVKGARTQDGKEWRADRTVLCAGANAPGLLDFKDQLRPTAWTLAHIQMTDEEVKLYKNLPVLFNVERGFFMEPDEDAKQLKLCDEHPGYCNWTETASGARASVPFAKHQIPLASEARARSFLREIMPHLAERPFAFARICWCADTPNRAFLISRHPEHASLVLGAGASGHGFMHIPVIGGYIADAMEGRLEDRMQRSWRWRPETAVDRNWEDTQGRFGGDNVVMDLRNVGEDQWTCIEPKL
ncbi:uncharacterized protein K452DRAFT_294763 [Aplosporella prunicola CBS 121167]|uniref:FAD dependent oxidoreductase domain-containing protein n=1 Tax=Aplosporella prunicola CBS 121167 TaxID=1176127 RepID=A0A6A6BPT9_9PEZI|nr:uncharacterized protein K452DRAFT_294763 [Aplosporella prunicola CBS 121167]KAF2146159.1 hypothetical protein K452DRAFT_294763 [Aplosporella prunicola CBS 121167]